jgi:hypothetical protein
MKGTEEIAAERSLRNRSVLSAISSVPLPHSHFAVLLHTLCPALDGHVVSIKNGKGGKPRFSDSPESV